MQFTASYFDGKSQEPHKVKVHLDALGDSWIVEGDGVGRLRFPVHMLATPEPVLGSTRGIIPLAGETRLEFDNTDEIEGLMFGSPNSSVSRFLVWSKTNLKWIIAALILAVALGWAMVVGSR